MRILKLIVSVSLLMTLVGCQRLDAGDYGVVFSAMPRFLGGGVRGKLIQPGETEIIYPWEKLYRMSTTSQTLGWGEQLNVKKVEDYVETRAKDGNEVGLAMKVRYRVNPSALHHIIQKVGTTREQIDELVTAVARADIRTHMNTLRTRDFFSPKERQQAVERVKHALATRLEPEGIIVEDVLFDGYQFERRLPDGTVDKSYQEQIDQTQALYQETEQEKKKVATVIEQKRQELNDALAKVNRAVEQADGFKRQAIFRGDAYQQAKTNEAEQILALGNAEVEGLKQQIMALRGAGGRALVRMALADELIKNKPKFVVIPRGNGGGNLEVQKLDTNQLLRELGVLGAITDAIDKTQSPSNPPLSK